MPTPATTSGLGGRLATVQASTKKTCTPKITTVKPIWVACDPMTRPNASSRAKPPIINDSALRTGTSGSGRGPGLAPDPAGALTGSAATAARTAAQTRRGALAPGRADRTQAARAQRRARTTQATSRARNRRSAQRRPGIAGAITAVAVVGAVARQHPTDRATSDGPSRRSGCLPRSPAQPMSALGRLRRGNALAP